MPSAIARRIVPLTAAGVAVALLLVSASPALGQATFYEAYDQAERAEREARLEEARTLFLAALSMRPEPGRRVKTYGLNFLDTYDPHIHLARIAVRLERPEEAEVHLGRARAAAVSGAEDLRAVEADLARLRARRVPTAVPPSPTGVRATMTPREGSGLAARETAPPAPASTVRPAIPPATTTSPGSPTPVISPPMLPRTELKPPTATPRPPDRTPEPRRTPVPVLTPTAAAGEVDVRGMEVPASAATPVRPRPSPVAPPSTALAWLPTAVLSLAALGILAGLLTLWLRRERPTAVPGSHAAGPVGPAVEPSEPGTVVAPRPATSPGAPFGAYRLEEILGRGGMGTTYRAVRVRDGLPVAIKIPHEHLLDKPELVSRFLREGELGVTLHHPNIIRIYEAGEASGHPFIAMELVAGRTLEKVLEGGRALPPRQALGLAREIALALDYAHMKGVVHRDLKPDNVMVLPDGTAKVMDYGIARHLGLIGLTATDVYLGTPLYSAPESLRPSEVDTQSDLYSLGIVLYRMLTGALPFHATNPLELLQKHAVEPLPPFPPELNLPPVVWELVSRLSAKRKDERYQTAELFLRDLDAILHRM